MCDGTRRTNDFMWHHHSSKERELHEHTRTHELQSTRYVFKCLVDESGVDSARKRQERSDQRFTLVAYTRAEPFTLLLVDFFLQDARVTGKSENCEMSPSTADCWDFLPNSMCYRTFIDKEHSTVTHPHELSINRLILFSFSLLLQVTLALTRLLTLSWQALFLKHMSLCRVDFKGICQLLSKH